MKKDKPIVIILVLLLNSVRNYACLWGVILGLFTASGPWMQEPTREDLIEGYGIVAASIVANLLLNALLFFIFKKKVKMKTKWVWLVLDGIAGSILAIVLQIRFWIG